MFLRRLPRFEYHSPKSVAEALNLMAGFEGRAEAYAGGTDLLVEMKRREKTPEHLIDLKGIEGMKGIDPDGKGAIRIGALTTLGELERSDVVRGALHPLWDAVNVMASPQIRTLATIGGNLCSAMPSADTAPPLIALGGSVRIAGLDGERTLPVEGFFKGPGQSDLKSCEILLEILIPGPKADRRGAFFKLMRRSAMDLAQVSVAVCLGLDRKDKGVCREARIALGASGLTPIRAPKAEEFLVNKKISQAVAGEAGNMASGEASPRSSIRASREYRQSMIRVLTERAILEAAKRPVSGKAG